MSFADLKSRRQSSISKLTAAAEAVGGGEKKSYTDDRIWKFQRDKQGNGYAVLRFLPAAEGNELPWNRFWDHGFQGPTGQWYIENSLTSLGQEDPVGQLNARLWNSGHEADKEKARNQKRRLHYVANVLVVSDPANPHNEGRIMIYQFGKKIFDKLMDAMKPEFQDEEPLNPFDFWTGADFKLKARVVDGWVNYDKSEFAAPRALSEDDEELERIYHKLHDLREFTDPKKYKSYDELKSRLMTVLGEEANSGAATMRQEAQLGNQAAAPSYRAEDVELDDDIPYDRFNSNDTASKEPAEEEDTLSYFAKLAAG